MKLLILMLCLSFSASAVTLTITPGPEIVGAPVTEFVFRYGSTPDALSSEQSIPSSGAGVVTHVFPMADGTYYAAIEAHSSLTKSSSDLTPLIGFDVVNDVATMHRPNAPSVLIVQ